jgi:hypothetical protein
MSARTPNLEFEPAQGGWAEDQKVLAVIQIPLRLNGVHTARENIKLEWNLFACGESRMKAEGRPSRGDLN